MTSLEPSLYSAELLFLLVAIEYKVWLNIIAIVM